MKILPIPAFDGYFAGEDGNIYSNRPKGPKKYLQFKKEPSPLKKLKPRIQSNGKYFYVSIRADQGEIKTNRVHRLVCLAFHGLPPEPNSTVSHLDGNWRNNIPSNLQWESMSDNHNRKKEHGTDDIGIKNSRASIDIDTLRAIRRLLKTNAFTQKEIGAKFGLSRLFITKIANGHRYKNQGMDF